MPLNKNKRSSQQSLARKLAILYASTTFSVLLIASGLLYWSLLDHLQKEHESLVTAKIIELRHYFKSSSLLGETLYGLIDAEHHHSEATHSSAIHPSIPHHVFVRIFDEQNNLLVESNLPPTVPRSLNFPLVDSKSTQSISITKELSKTDQFFLLGSAWAQTTSDQQPRQVLIQAVLQLAPDESLLTAFQRTLSAVLIFGVIASALSGYWVTRRGLRPLRQITKTIHNINAHQLNEQVNSGQWPEEIALLANAFDKMLARLEQSFTRLSQFSADLAHELRTPVNNLMGTAEVALSRERPSEEYREILESNIEECHRIARMIDELLFLARAENQKTEINREYFVIEKEFKLVTEFYELLASEQQVAISYQSSQLKLYADPNLLRRVLSNLISNALQHTEAQDTINLTATISAAKSVTITITDTGEGINEAILPHIFDRFFRADKSRQHNRQGSGLGLAIVKSIMDLHGGQVLISSQLQKGTQVELIFPPEL